MTQNEYRMAFRRTGGAEVIQREDIATPVPGPGEAVVRQQAIGLNFIDTYQRGGLYPVLLPSGLGSEAAGVVEAVGEGVETVRPGDRVAYFEGPPGAYSTIRTMAADVLIALPDAVDDATAAAVLLKGLTADMLVGACAKVRAGQTVLVLAAGGGVGSLLVQWLTAIGAVVIAHAGSAEKATRATALGAAHALSCDFGDLAGRVRELTNGSGVDVVLDGVGQASWGASLGAVTRRGLIVSYGNASGAVPPVPPLALGRAGSVFLTRPSLYDYITTEAERAAAAGRLFAMLESGRLHVDIGQTFPLERAADAHRAIEARATTGSTVMLT